jgi:hypothetical protein
MENTTGRVFARGLMEVQLLNQKEVDTPCPTVTMVIERGSGTRSLKHFQSGVNG